MPNLRLTIPEPQINLYEDGFEGICQLERAKDGKKLSDLVERITEPMVVAVDAPWGAGKSVFLKCWVGAHVLENEGLATTVYFDAFQHDYMDDPLIGLTGVLTERFDNKGPKAKWLKTATEAAAKLARPIGRIGLAVITAGATETTGAIVDAGLTAGSKELAKASEAFWKKEDGKRAAMQEFRGSLEVLAAEQKLVIVVDELDRCRPDYALNLLEVIKHFFSVKNVHFVLGVNLKELGNAVKARYGSEARAEKYLQKFVTVKMPLIPRPSRSASSQLQIRYFSMVAEAIGLRDSLKYDWLIEYLGYVDHHVGLSLRDVERIATLAVVTPSPSQRPPARVHLYIGLLILQVISPHSVERARSGKLSENDIFSVFRLRKRPQGRSGEHDAHIVWCLTSDISDKAISVYLNEASDNFFEGYDPADLLRAVVADCLDVFELPY